MQALKEFKKKVCNPQMLELQAGVNYLTWVLETEASFSVRAICVPNCGGLKENGPKSEWH